MENKDFELMESLSNALKDARYYAKDGVYDMQRVWGTDFYVQVVDKDFVLYEMIEDGPYIWVKIPIPKYSYYKFIVDMMYICITY